MKFNWLWNRIEWLHEPVRRCLSSQNEHRAVLLHWREHGAVLLHRSLLKPSISWLLSELAYVTFDVLVMKSNKGRWFTTCKVLHNSYGYTTAGNNHNMQGTRYLRCVVTTLQVHEFYLKWLTFLSFTLSSLSPHVALLCVAFLLLPFSPHINTSPAGLLMLKCARRTTDKMLSPDRWGPNIPGSSLNNNGNIVLQVDRIYLYWTLHDFPSHSHLFTVCYLIALTLRCLLSVTFSLVSDTCTYHPVIKKNSVEIGKQYFGMLCQQFLADIVFVVSLSTGIWVQHIAGRLKRNCFIEHHNINTLFW